MDLGDPSQPAPAAREMDHHRQGRRQLAVQRRPVESRGRAERLEPRRDVRGRIGVDGPASARVFRLAVHAVG